MKFAIIHRLVGFLVVLVLSVSGLLRAPLAAAGGIR